MKTSEKERMEKLQSLMTKVINSFLCLPFTMSSLA